MSVSLQTVYQSLIIEVSKTDITYINMEMSEIRVTPQLSPEITESIHFQTLWYPIKLAKFFREDGFEFYYKGESLGEDFDILASCSEITFEN